MSNEDPYNTLKLPRDATQEQIKSAYRKLALRYHPDRQTSEEDKQRCGEIFANISSAYEILGDEQRRAEFDRYGTAGGQGQQGAATAPAAGGGDPFMNGGFHGNHPFQSFNHGRGGFTDPFDMFRNMFGDEFGFQQQHDPFSNNSRNGHQQQQQQARRNVGVSHNQDLFGMMDSMMRQSFGDMHNSSPFGHGQNQQQQQRTPSSQFYSSSSSSSFFGGNGGSGGTRESISTSTRIINGKRQTVTERTVMKPDGTVETTTETSGDDDFPSLETGNSNRRSLMGWRR